MKKKYTIWIGLPAFNEENAIKSVLKRILLLKNTTSNFGIKVIIFNDGSKDNTIKNARSFNNKLKLYFIDKKKNQGLGIAIYSLLSYFKQKSNIKDKLILMDCDNTHDPQKILEMNNKIKEKENVVVIASRYQNGSKVKNVPFKRQILSHLAFITLNIIYKTKGVRDFTSGYSLYDKKAVNNFFLELKNNYMPKAGFEMQLELILKLRKTNVKFFEIPFILDYKKKPTKSKMNVFKTILSYLNLIFIKS